jgi:hypothetical protein
MQQVLGEEADLGVHGSPSFDRAEAGRGEPG